MVTQRLAENNRSVSDAALLQIRIEALGHEQMVELMFDPSSWVSECWDNLVVVIFAQTLRQTQAVHTFQSFSVTGASDAVLFLVSNLPIDVESL